MTNESGPKAAPEIAAAKQDQPKSTASDLPDRVALGAVFDTLEQPLEGSADLGYSLLLTCAGDVATALGVILVRLSRLEREVRQ